MAKNNKKQVLNDVNAEEEVVQKAMENQESKKAKKEAKAPKKAKAVKAEPKKSKIKETFGELKKVTWPSFGKAMKQTGMVLSLVLVFGVLVLGIDLLISFIINTLSSI